MKVIVAAVIVALCIVSSMAGDDEQKKMLKKLYDECVQETGVDKDLIVNARKGDFKDDEKLNNYFDCMAGKTGFKDENGKIKVAAVIAKLPENMDKEKATAAVTNCTNTDANLDKKKVAVTVFKCFVANMGKEIKLF